MTLVEFVLARLSDRADAAEACAKVYPTPWELSDRGWMATIRGDEPLFRVVATLEQGDEDPPLDPGDALWHIARHDPQRTLAQVNAHRRIVDMMTYSSGGIVQPFGPEQEAVLRMLASVDDDHPDYRSEWSVS